MLFAVMMVQNYIYDIDVMLNAARPMLTPFLSFCHVYRTCHNQSGNHNQHDSSALIFSYICSSNKVTPSFKFEQDWVEVASRK